MPLSIQHAAPVCTFFKKDFCPPPSSLFPPLSLPSLPPREERESERNARAREPRGLPPVVWGMCEQMILTPLPSQTNLARALLCVGGSGWGERQKKNEKKKRRCLFFEKKLLPLQFMKQSRPSLYRQTAYVPRPEIPRFLFWVPSRVRLFTHLPPRARSTVRRSSHKQQAHREYHGEDDVFTGEPPRRRRGRGHHRPRVTPDPGDRARQKRRQRQRWIIIRSERLWCCCCVFVVGRDQRRRRWCRRSTTPCAAGHAQHARQARLRHVLE